MNKKFKYFLASLCVFVLLLPAMEFKLQLFDCEPLQGGVNIANEPELNKKAYWSLKWQEEYGKYINDNFGFRPWFVKLINQIRFSLFNTSKAQGVIIGKNNEMFIESYINEYIGRNFLGNSIIQENVRKIKLVQDSLKARNIDLVIVFAPGKAGFNADLLPDSYLSKKKDSTNYNSYRNLFLKNEVNFIDLNAWFTQQKNNFKYPVFPKYGAHWNHYGMCLALDSLIRYIENHRNIQLPDFNYSKINFDSDLKGNDFDIGILTNLMFPVQKDVNPYPIYKFSSSTEVSKPDVLFIGDSYWWCLVGDNIPSRLFKEDEYWFYNKDVLIKNSKQEKTADKLNLSASIAQRDVIVLMATEATYYMFPYGFIDKLYKLKCEDHSKRYQEIFSNMITRPDWMQQMQVKANQTGISLNEQMRRDAEFLICNEVIRPKKDIELVIKEIRENPSWLEEIRKKAIQNNISIEQQIRKDAEWKIEND